MKDGGKQYAACAAIFAGYVFDTQITSNTISDFSCTKPHHSAQNSVLLTSSSCRQQYFGRLGLGRHEVPRIWQQ
jgi:hypothetical protein